MSQNYLSIYAKSFNWAGFFLPKSKYNNCSTLYDFCRTVDNIADEEEKLEIKKKNFKEFKKRFYEKDFSSIKIRNMWQLIHEFSISTKIIDDLFDGTSYGYCVWVDPWGFEMQYFEDPSQPFYFDYQTHYDLDFSIIS